MSALFSYGDPKYLQHLMRTMVTDRGTYAKKIFQNVLFSVMPVRTNINAHHWGNGVPHSLFNVLWTCFQRSLDAIPVWYTSNTISSARKQLKTTFVMSMKYSRCCTAQKPFKTLKSVISSSKTLSIFVTQSDPKSSRSIKPTRTCFVTPNHEQLELNLGHSLVFVPLTIYSLNALRTRLHH